MTQETHSADDELQTDANAAPSSEASASATATASSSSSSDTQALEDEIASLQEQVALTKESALRAQAEAQNSRRRAEQDVEKAHKYALEKFTSDLLPVADNLERAVTATAELTGDVTAVTEGVELTLKTLVDALKRHNVEQIDPQGEPFDPQLHQAMTAVENAEMEPNTVMDVFQKGYALNGRLVRPAMVVVSKAPGE